MPNNQEFVDPLPEDNRLWLVKYIDQYHLADGGGESTAVYVLFQHLTEYSLEDISQVDVHAVQNILGFRQRTDARREFMLKRLLVGTLCTISIGDVFLNGRCQGRLLSQMKTVQFAPGESDELEYTLGQALDGPPGWLPEKDYHILNAFEYCGMYDHRHPAVTLSKSRVAVLHRKNGQEVDTFVIPRSVIFSSFYACHTLMANAFCNAPWETSFNQVIALNWSGGEPATQIDPETKHWNIVVQRNIELRFAALLAILHFDDYGRTQANLIHTKNLIDRKANGLTAYYASAKIPLQAVNEPLRLNLTCLQLRSRRYKDEQGGWHTSNKYLVTAISGSSWPSHYPTIARNNINSNDEGEHVMPTPEPPPYSGTPQTRRSNGKTRLRSNVDAKEDSTTTLIEGNLWDWLDEGPQYIDLQKKNSKHYKDKSPPPPPKEDGDEASTGNRNHKEGSAPKGQASSTPHQDIDSFTAIVEAFKKLKKSKKISSTAFVQAERLEQKGTSPGGYPCWKFNDEFAIALKSGPAKGWRTVYEFSGEKWVACWRTALVLTITFREVTYYWIEIEARSSDYQSVLIKVRDQDRIKTIEAALTVIAKHKGRWLDKHLQDHFKDTNVGIRCYKHRKITEKRNAKEKKVSMQEVNAAPAPAPPPSATTAQDTNKSPNAEDVGKLSPDYILDFFERSAQELKDKGN